MTDENLVLARVQSEEDDDTVEVALDFPPADASGKAAEGVRPFFLPSLSDQRISTRQITTGSDRRRHKAADFATVAYNGANEPWLKYVPTGMADRGFTSGHFIISRFNSDVLYLEAPSCAPCWSPPCCSPPAGYLLTALRGLLFNSHILCLEASACPIAHLR